MFYTDVTTIFNSRDVEKGKKMGKKILIVDDSKTSREVLIDKISSSHSEILEATNGFDALRIIQNSPIDLIISDLMMPKIDGFTLCKKLKECNTTRNIPIIIFSDFSDSKRVEEGFSLGVWAFVPKSQPDEIRTIIKRWDESHKLVNGKKVLVVDDSPTITAIISSDLTLDGYQVKVVHDGTEAWELLKSWTPDIVVTDLEMPNMGGHELIEKIQNSNRIAHIPIVAISLNSDRSTIMETVQKGAITFLTKPFGSGQLSLTLELILSNQFRLLDEVRKRVETERNMLLSALTSLVKALEVKDKYTAGHSEAVSKYAVMIGKYMRFPESRLDNLKLAGLLHDIGKIGIKDNILNKHGKLTESEYSIIKSHVDQLEVILGPISSAKEILDAAKSHHERWDGSGYPRGLKEEEIPLEGRILAVADVYHALTSDRSYRNANSKDQALKIIRDGMGKDFCPTVTKVFLTLMETIE